VELKLYIPEGQTFPAYKTYATTTRIPNGHQYPERFAGIHIKCGTNNFHFIRLAIRKNVRDHIQFLWRWLLKPKTKTTSL